VFRVEFGSDPYVLLPDIADYVHVGHTIRIHQDNMNENLDVQVYKFDHNHTRPPTKSLRNRINLKTKSGKGDHEVLCYVRALEKINKSNLAWGNRFVGEEGKGVHGLDDETRVVV